MNKSVVRQILLSIKNDSLKLVVENRAYFVKQGELHFIELEIGENDIKVYTGQQHKVVFVTGSCFEEPLKKILWDTLDDYVRAVVRVGNQEHLPKPLLLRHLNKS